ncbi:MAG TPA: PPC domain-containing protein, partial [Longimicrobiales bacterium]|nr:PPC domain-containing protein [Longimicrobiales bacterium]
LSEQGAGSRYHLEVTAAGADDLCDAYSLAEGRLLDALLALDPLGRTLEVGRETAGVLGVDDEVHPSEGTPIQAWSLVAEPGTTVWVDEVSNDFDPLLRVLSAQGDEVTSDDFDEGWNSRVEVTVPADGRLLVLAGAFSADGSGAFLLRVSTDPPPLEVNTGGGGGAASVSTRVDASVLAPAAANPQGSLTMGTEVRGNLGDDDVVLDDGNRAQAWTFSGRAGDEVILVLTSDDFDSIMYLAGPGLGDPLSNDDGGPGLGSRLEVRLPETGTYSVVVGALSEGTGAYQLLLVRPAGD